MYHYNIQELDKLTTEIKYIDEVTEQECVGIVLHVERVSMDLAFVYVADPYKENNDKHEGDLHYKHIFVFDNQTEITKDGFARNPIREIYKDVIVRD